MLGLSLTSVLRKWEAKYPRVCQGVKAADAALPVAAVVSAAIAAANLRDLIGIALVFGLSKICTMEVSKHFDVATARRLEWQAGLRVKVENAELKRKNRIVASNADKAVSKLKLERQALTYKLEKQNLEPAKLFFDGKYNCLEGVLGAGGSAIVLKVWNATHVAGKWTGMAMKTLHPKMFLVPELRSANLNEQKNAKDLLKEAIERLQGREAAAMSTLIHPSIVHFYGSREMSREDYLRVIEEAGFEEYAILRQDPSIIPEKVPYILMEEILNGEPLDEKIKYGALPMDEAVGIAEQIARAMQFINEEKMIVHRDMKPGNVMIISDPQTPGVYTIKIMDLGLAKFEEVDEPGKPKDEKPKMKETAVNRTMGSPQYHAPEQLFSIRSVDKLSDQYAFGVMLYEALTGLSPYIEDHENDDDVTLEEMSKRILNSRIVNIRERLPGIPEELARIVEKAMCNKKEGRYQKWGLIISGLESAKALIPAENLHELASAEVAGDFVFEPEE